MTDTTYTRLQAEIAELRRKNNTLEQRLASYEQSTPSPRTPQGDICEYELLRAVLDAEPSGICVLDRDGSIKLMNAALKTLLQVGNSVALHELHLHPQLVTLCADIPERVVATGGSLSLERRLEGHLGTYQWFQTTGMPLTVEDRQQYVLLMITDITARKISALVLEQAHSELEERVKERTVALAELNQRLEKEVQVRREAEEQIGESEERYKSLFFANQAVKMLIEVDSGRIVEANEAAEELYGYSRKGLLARTIFDLYEYPAAKVKEWMEIVQRQGRLALSTQQVLADGSLRDVELYAGLINNRRGQLIFSIVHDITERKRTEQLVAEHQMHIDALLNASFHVAMLMQVDGRIIAHNRAAALTLKHADADIVGENLYGHIHGKVVEQVHWVIQKAVTDKSPVALEVEHDDRYWNMTWYPVVTPDSDVSAIAVYAEDVTQQRVASNRLRKLSARVLSAQENERQRIGRELHDSTAQTLSGIKFMVEAQLAAIKKWTKGTGPSPAIEPFEKIVTLLQGAIIELRRIIMDLRPTVLDDLGLISALRWLQQDVMTMYPALHIVARLHVAEEKFTDMQKSVLFRVAQEALGNAGKHSSGTTVHISLSADEGVCVLQVDDNGRGFSEEGFTGRGIGLDSMRERLEMISGTLYLGKSDTGGASIQAVVPLMTTIENDD